jgi:hypothetical protein
MNQDEIGLALLLLHQTNREGKQLAVKAGGYYTGTSAMAQASEVERSADVISTSYVDETLKAVGLIRFQNLKHRDNPWFETVEVPIDPISRKLSNPPDRDEAYTAEEAIEALRRL